MLGTAADCTSETASYTTRNTRIQQITMRILLFGSNGQVGSALQTQGPGAGNELIALSREQCDLADSSAVRRTIREAAADVIVNAAAFTAVDRAESERELCFAINADSAAAMGEEA